MRRLVRLSLFLLLALACLPVAPAAAVPFPVTSTADDGPGSLRDAIEKANGRMGPDSIPIEANGTIVLGTALPQITDDVAIAGRGAGSLTVTRTGLLEFRIFEFASGVTASLSGVTVTNGVAPIGGGISNGSGSLTLTGVVVTGNVAVEVGGSSPEALGGGIRSIGPLTLRESVVSNNLAAASGGATTDARGGGIRASGALTIDRSTISGNAARALAQGGEEAYAEGGGVSAPAGPMTIERSTISGNSALAAEAFYEDVATGGGIDGGMLSLTSATVTGNSVSAPEVAGANLAVSSSGTVRNTIVADPVGDESCGVGLASGGFNIDEDSSCEFGDSTDREALDPLLGPLASNGGPTPTHALLEGSAAIDSGSSFGSAADQRGLPRPSDFPSISNREGGDGSDVGAFELQLPVAPAPPVLVQAQPADRQAPNTRIVFAPPRSTFKRLAKFRFASTEPQSHFHCRLDNRPWRKCRNPYKRKVSAGTRHLFWVRAIDRFGNVDPTPARFGWRVNRIVG